MGDDVVTLGPADFQRIGIQPKETRLDVIRRAASRAAKSLARRQLDAPNPITEEQLSRIAVSTYRLLDPRQREDRQSRAHVGRIRPHALYRAGRTEFADGRILIQSCESSDRSVSTHHVNDVICVDDVFPLVNPPSRPLHRVRSLASHPGMILVMIMLLLLTAAAIWYWGQTLHSWPARLVPTAESV